MTKELPIAARPLLQPRPPAALIHDAGGAFSRDLNTSNRLLEDSRCKECTHKEYSFNILGEGWGVFNVRRRCLVLPALVPTLNITRKAVQCTE